MMTSFKFEDSSFKTQCKVLKELANQFIKSEIIIANYKNFQGMVLEKDELYVTSFFQDNNKIVYGEYFIHYINSIFAKLRGEYTNIIYNEFFLKQDKCWWFNKYSRSTFYRLKKRAVKEFISYVV